MGIFQFNSWFMKSIISKGAITDDPPQNVDILCIDGNGIVHSTYYNTTDDNVVIYRTIEYIKRIVRGIKPSFYFLLAFDGVPPQGKINQQMARRFAGDSGSDDPNDPLSPPYIQSFNNLKISPGTNFMSTLSDSFKKDIEKELLQKDNIYPSNILFSGDLVPGEGEHKIAEVLRNMKSHENRNQTVCIHGLDSDLFMIFLPLVHKFKDIILMKDNADAANFHVSKNIKYVSLKTVHKNIIENYPSLNPINDFVFIMTLIGNDFVPRFHFLESTAKAIDVILNCYKKFNTDNPKSSLIDRNGHMLFKNINTFLKMLVNDFKYDIIGITINHVTATNYNNPYKYLYFQEFNNIKNPEDKEEVDELGKKMQNFNNKYVMLYPALNISKDVYNINPYVIKNKVRNYVSILEEKKYEISNYNQVIESYHSKFEIFKKATNRVYDTINTFQMPPNHNLYIGDLVNNYIEGLFWVYNYYVYGVKNVDVNWYYKYNYAPCLFNIASLDYISLRNIHMRVTTPVGSFLYPDMQLLSILPKNKHDIIDIRVRNCSKLLDYHYPSSFKYDPNMKTAEFMRIPIIQTLNPNVVRNVVTTYCERLKELGIDYNYKKVDTDNIYINVLK